MKSIPIDPKAVANLIGQAKEFAEQSVAEIAEDAIGDTPIEKLFFAALRTRIQLGVSEYSAMWIAENEELEKHWLGLEAAIARPLLIIRAQANIEDGWRVDFLIHAYDHARKGGPPGWRKLIVECDGHDYHERTKEQAAKDRGRDRWSVLNKYTILRFTGSELHKDAWGCAAQVTDWAVEGFP